MLRIYSYYLPIWVCSVLSAVIYFAVGYHVFHMRNQLRNLSLSNQGKEATYDSTDVRDSAEKVCDLCFLEPILPTTDPSCQPPIFLRVFFPSFFSPRYENKVWWFIYHRAPRLSTCTERCDAYCQRGTVVVSSYEGDS